MSLHRLLFDSANPAESANVGAYLRMFDNGKLVSYSNLTEAGSISFDFVDGDVTVGTDTIAETAHGLETGDIVQLSTTGTLPSPLAAATDYYVIRVDADNFKLASSLENAEAGTAIDITSAAGGGTHTVTEQDREHNAMDVNIVNEISVTQGTSPWVIGDGGSSITVDASQLDIDDLNATDDAVAAWLNDGSGNAIGSTAGSLDVNITNSVLSIDDNGGSITVDGSVTVSATDLDIRDLTHVSDSVKIGDGTDFLAIAADGSIAVTDNGTTLSVDDGGGSLTVDATQLDIDDLNATDDAVAAWLNDGSGNAITSSAGALDVNIQSSDIEIDVEDDLADTAIASASETVTTSSAALNTSDLANRRFIWMYNNGNKEIFIGPSGVATGDGFPLFPGSILEARIGPNVAIHAVSASGSQDIRVLQAS